MQRQRTSCGGWSPTSESRISRPRREAQPAQTLRDLRVLHHAAADEGDAALELLGEVHEQLQAVHARRERRDHELARGAAEDLLEAVEDVALGSRVAAAVGVGAVGEERQDAARPELGEPVQVERLAVERRLIDLEVARMDDRARRRVNRQRQAVGDAVRHAQELDAERAGGHRLPRLDDRQAPVEIDAVLVELRFDQRQGEFRAEHGAVDAIGDVGDGADVVLVPVRQDETDDAALVGVERREIGDDEVDAEQLGLGEHHAGVDEQSFAATGDDQHVHAEFADTTERKDVHRRLAAGALWNLQRPDLTHPDTRARANGRSPAARPRRGCAASGPRCPPELGRWEGPAEPGWKTGRL